MLFIPKYYAHGYECLSETCKVLYHLDSYRDQKNESGLSYNDKKLKIKWKTKNPIIAVVGEKELRTRTINVRRLGHKDSKTIPLNEAIKELSIEAMPPDIKELNQYENKQNQLIQKKGV